jgi:hypothetical protein
MDFNVFRKKAADKQEVKENSVDESVNQTARITRITCILLGKHINREVALYQRKDGCQM